MEVTVLKKMSMKTLEAQERAKDVRKKENGTVERLARVYGIANGIKGGESDYGPFNALIGQFEGQNMVTGKMYQSARLFMPGGLEEIVMSALAGSDDAKGVMFALEISAVADDKSSVGYRYQAHSLIPPAQNDVLAPLRKQAMAQLEAGKTVDVTPEPEKLAESGSNRSDEAHAEQQRKQHSPPPAQHGKEKTQHARR